MTQSTFTFIFLENVHRTLIKAILRRDQKANRGRTVRNKLRGDELAAAGRNVQEGILSISSAGTGKSRDTGRSIKNSCPRDKTPREKKSS